MKEFTVEYGKDKYTRNSLNNEALTMLALRFQAKFSAFSNTGFDIMRGDNSGTFERHQCIMDIFKLEDWKWLIDEIIYNPDCPIAVNGKYLDPQETIDHFAGDALRLLTVTYKMAVKNMGEHSIFMKSLNGFTKSIAGYLKEMVKTYSKDVAASVNLYAKAQSSTKPAKKQKNK